MEFLYVVFGLALLALALYTLIPDLFPHRLGWGSWKRQFGPGVCLTFDDGPNPQFTPRVLETLHKHDCKAVFFLVGERAAKYPDLVAQIKQAGHIIGAHALRHRHAWLMTPWATWREWDQCLALLEELSGQPIEFVRPPWGTFNLVTWFWCKTRGKRPVLWGAEGHDWLQKNSPQVIVARILRRVRPGTIVVLHDSGGEAGAPENSLQALDLLCKAIVKDKKLPLLPLEFPDWPLGRRLFFQVWEIWERIYAHFSPAVRVSSTNLLKLAKIKYSGPNLLADNGDTLAKAGDIVAELHLESIRLTGNSGDAQGLGLQALKQFRRSMPELARYIVDDPQFQDIQVFLGQTFLNRGVQILGFQVQELPKAGYNPVVGWIQKGVMRVYHPMGKDRGTSRLGERPKLVWISRQTLIDKWLKKVN